MKKVKIGVIGLGNMGYSHVKEILEGKAPLCEIGAICDIKQIKIDNAKRLSDDLVAFTDYKEMMKSGLIDAVLIAVPHYDHPKIAMEAFENDLHVLIEKPAGVYSKAVRKMNEVAEKSGKVFAIMFQTRTNPVFIKAKEMIENGDLGEIKRVILIITNWMRTQTYYNSGGWRATWEGEGGGVLLNQDPHQLDLLQWLCGVPTSVMAECYEGKFHDIEVEDDVVAYMGYENGATGLFASTTGEFPGTNRWEIAGDYGKIIIEDDQKISFYKSSKKVSDYIKSSKESFKGPDLEIIDVKAPGEFTKHMGIVQNFCEAILNGVKLIAPGYEGLKGLEISNAMHLSSWTNSKVSIPVDQNKFYNKLREKIKNSKYVKKEAGDVVIDLTGSH